MITSFDKEMTTPIAAQLIKNGVELLLSETTVSLAEGPEGLGVRLKSGKTLSTRLVVVGVEMKPENSLAVAGGLTVGPGGGIRVNDQVH